MTENEIRTSMTSEQIQLERKLTCEAIDGAMAFGYQNTNPPPSDDHWLTPFWKIGPKQAELEARAVQLPASANAGAMTLPQAVLDVLRFYANGHHFTIDEDHQQFDTVSGEPQNWLCSEREDDCTMIEDGSVARAVLIGAQPGFEGPTEPIEGEVFILAPQAQPAARTPEGIREAVGVETRDDWLDDIRRAIRVYASACHSKDNVPAAAAEVERLLAFAAPQARPVARVPEGFAIKRVEGHGWLIDPPSGSRWIAYEDTPAGDFMAALLAGPQAPDESDDERELDAHLIDRMSKLLAEIALVLNGAPKPMTRPSYHDLPDKVRTLQCEVELLRTREAPAASEGAQPSAITAAARDVLTERKRQVSGESFTPAQDDRYEDGSLAAAAGCYALHSGGYRMGAAGHAPAWWPKTWGATWWKPTTPRRDLVKAGALILSEIERIDRAAHPTNKEST